MFKYEDSHVINERGKAMDVSGGVDSDNRNIIMWNKHNGLNQQWDIVYVDEMKPEPKKGEMNDDFNLVVDRPFYIVSELKSKRHLTQLPGQRYSIIKTPNANKSQKFWWDQKTRTIRNYWDSSYSLEDAGNKQIGWGNSKAIPQQQFTYENGYIINVKTKKVFTVTGGKDVEAQEVKLLGRRDAVEQRWKIVYVEQFKEQNKGLIEDFGLFANRPFWIRSRLPGGRVAEC
jgi:hypothetical protein